MAGPPPPSPDDPKTTVETMAKIPQAHGGALNAGGTPGNKGGPGRPSNELKVGWLAAITAPEAIAARTAILADPSHPQWGAVYTKLCVLAGGLPGRQEDASDSDAIPHVHMDL